jgi:hypothetical protein
MTRPELEINQQDMWRILVFEQRTTLALAIEMLLRCQLSPEQILTKTATALEGSHYDSCGLPEQLRRGRRTTRVEERW